MKKVGNGRSRVEKRLKRLKGNVGALFPAVKYPSNFKAAVRGLAYATPTRRIYQLLAANGVFASALDVELEDKHGRERVIEWVSLAYLWDDEELDSPVVQKIFAAGADDLEIMSNFFWTVRGDKLTDRQTAKILSFWDRCLTWSRAQPRVPEQLLARLSRLSSYLDKLDEQGKARLLGVVPYVHSDYATDAMVEYPLAEIHRFVDLSDVRRPAAGPSRVPHRSSSSKV